MLPTIHTFVLGDYQTNCFVVTVPGTADCWIVDCGFEPDDMLDWIEQQQLRPIALLLTHAHSDHMAGIDAAMSRFGPMPLYIHEAEAEWCSNPMLNLSGLIGRPVTATRPDHLLKGGETLELAGTHWRVLHTPGHSPGGVCYVNDESRQALVGDVLFAGSIGRVDFPTSNPAAMRRTLREVMMNLPDDLTIYPGHGPATTIGRERRSNPYIIGGF
ncbi:MAG TPA: MBL fold metallo-hydrolase [Phycisphaerales bacterium]|nr:MBL fold metallo-hydrolase [Phycisphaerales bacterium]